MSLAAMSIRILCRISRRNIGSGCKILQSCEQRIVWRTASSVATKGILKNSNITLFYFETWHSYLPSVTASDIIIIISNTLQIYRINTELVIHLGPMGGSTTRTVIPLSKYEHTLIQMFCHPLHHLQKTNHLQQLLSTWHKYLGIFLSDDYKWINHIDWYHGQESK